ncbi:hypothetical protein OEZ86_004407 [Tetradesmus obliquus]|nr:hypothetical protein OEZ86_004407 [Tetradesmus obliquus]
MTSTHKLHEDDLLQLRADEFTQRYKVVSKLGSGAFADVLRVKDLRGGRDCAVKVLRPAAAHPAGLQPEVALFREARALKHAKHPNIVGLVSVLRVPALGSIGLSKRSSILRGLPGEGSGSSRSSGSSSQHGSCWGLMLEYVQDGSLAQVLYKQMVNPFPRAYSDTAALTWAVDLASAVAHLHGLSPCIIHRDLKLENILMQKPEAQPAAPAGRKLPLAKINDFGLHVMLETPPCPYLITSNGGCPRASPSSAAAAAGGDCGSDSGVGFRAVGVAGGECYDDVTDILAAANMERDYEVSMSEAHDRAASSSSWSRAPSVASSLHAGSSSRPPTPRSVRANTAAAAAAAAAGGVDHLTLADVGSISGRCWDGVPATTAASMLWEDMMEDDDCQELLDGPGHPGCASGPLAYDLTQHTGSYMYMAPEIYRGEPYNESVDVFSLGVILYELFSRSLLLYTQTPASKPSDTEAYAARVAGGFRPPRPVNMHAGVWGVIERCWAADPTARPAAAWVLQQLQQLLQAEEAAAAAAERRKSSSGIAGAISKLRGAGRRSMDAYAAARLERRGGSTIDEDAATGAVAAAHGLVAADASNVDDSGAAAGAGSAGAAGDSGDGKATVVAVAACTGAESLQDKPAPAACSAAGMAAGSGTAMRKPHGKKAEPACGCVIC